MIQTTRTASLVLLIATALVLFGLGCSHETSLDPVGSNVESTTEISQSSPDAPLSLAEPGTFVETFDNYSNEGGWSFATDHMYVIETTGGNPDWYVHDNDVESFAPHPETSLGTHSIFTGDYRQRNITSLGIDLRCFWYDGEITGRYLTLMLFNDNGTPFDVTDDWGAYKIGDVPIPSKYVPMKAAVTALATNVPGWVSYDFAINSQSRGLPDGWKKWSNSMVGGSKPSAGNWKDLMEDVSYVRFFFGDPTSYHLINDWDLGLDNPRISWE